MKNAFCFFVDEAGDTTLFDKKGSIIVGETGNSKVFMVGVAMVSDPRNVRIELNNLRQSLLKDPYFSGVPSMQPEAQKTCLYFHAKDDLPEVRREVFNLLKKLGHKDSSCCKKKIGFGSSCSKAF